MKIIIYIVVLVFLFITTILIGEILFKNLYPFPKQIKYGVTFSTKYAANLELDWKDTYVKILDDLKVRNLRIPAYWDVLEGKMGNLDFSQIDFMLFEAKKRDAKVILVLGIKQPRWPECHPPSWANNLSIANRQQKILLFISKVLERYKNNSEIVAFQVENEPFLESFGMGCDKPDENFLRQEVDLTRNLTNKTIILTDSGELGPWIKTMSLSDIFGTTLYRDVYNSYIGYTTFPLLPYFYNLKSYTVRNLFAKDNEKTIIIELQGEPWSPDNNLLQMLLDKQIRLFPLKRFKQNVNFGKSTGFDEIYLWGVEWWYWMEMEGYPEYLDYAKTLFR